MKATREDKATSREVIELRAELFGRLGWAHWQRAESRRVMEAFPPAHPLF
jgi:hypothetical protein